jgi:hypothetical protein
MADVNTTVDNYIASWNESDPARRRRLIEETWTQDASYLDPQMSGVGPEGIDAMIAAAQERFPGHSFKLAGEPDAHNDRVRFTWHLVGGAGEGPVAIGVDLGVVADDGRLRE